MAAIIPKIRAGNQFTYLWAIERAGVAVDLTTATDIDLSYGVGKPCSDYSKIPFTVVDTNKISSSHLYGVTGTYNLKLEFKIDGEQSTIDIDAFRIVPRSEDASDSTQFVVTSDMAIGFKGDKLTFADLTPSDISELQQPANDAIVSIQAVEVDISDNENNRVDAEYDRNQEEINRQEQEVARQVNTVTAIQNVQTATTNANTATASANNAATNANNAATNANTKAGLADTAATNANTKAGLADTAATNANNVANGYAATLAGKEATANKQNSLAVDGTGAKFPTVDAVNAGLALKQTLAKTTLIEVQTPAFALQPTVDLANNKFLLSGLSTGNSGVLVENSCVDFMSDGTLPTGFQNWTLNYYFVHVVDANSFQLMTTRGSTASVVNLNNIGSGWTMRIAGVQIINTENISMEDIAILMRVIYVWGADTSVNGDLGICINVNKNLKYFGSQGYVSSIKDNIEIIRASVGGKKYGFGHHRISFLSNYPLVKINRDVAFIISDNKNLTGATVNADFLAQHTSFILNEPTLMNAIRAGVTGRTALWIGNGSQYKIIEK